MKVNYFFGKPLDNASVTMKASGMDAELFEAASAKGRTDRDGAYRFDLVLPQFFAGNGKRHGAAPVVVEATVKDAAEHSETRGEPITVSQTSLLITAVPEGGKLVRGLENEVFVLTSYPDGTPAKADLVVRTAAAQDRVQTDEAGIATVRIQGNDANSVLRIDADDHKGNRASDNVTLETRAGEDQVLVRTSHAVARPGDRMEIAVLSTQQRGAAYIDLVRDGQTILTRDVDLENGRAEMSVVVGPEMSGTLTINAYVIGRSGREVEDQRLVFVQPAEELHIETVADARSYLPGGEAKVQARPRVVGDRTLGGIDPETDAFLAVTERALVGAEASKSQRLQRRVVKALGLRDVANADRNMIDHFLFSIFVGAGSPKGRRRRSRAQNDASPVS